MSRFQKNCLEYVLDKVYNKQCLSKHSSKTTTAGRFFLGSVCQVLKTELVFWVFLIFSATLPLTNIRAQETQGFEKTAVVDPS